MTYGNDSWFTLFMNDALIAFAPTINGWEIGITKTDGHDGRTYFDVVRINPQGKYVEIDNFDNEADARKAANAWWKSDKGTGPSPRAVRWVA